MYIIQLYTVNNYAVAGVGNSVRHGAADVDSADDDVAGA